MPGMYAVTSMPLVSRTRQTLRRAEFGFLGVVVYTRVQTPRRCGEPCSAGVFAFEILLSLPLRTNWAIVGIQAPCWCPAVPVPWLFFSHSRCSSCPTAPGVQYALAVLHPLLVVVSDLRAARGRSRGRHRPPR